MNITNSGLWCYPNQVSHTHTHTSFLLFNTLSPLLSSPCFLSPSQGSFQCLHPDSKQKTRCQSCLPCRFYNLIGQLCHRNTEALVKGQISFLPCLLPFSAFLLPSYSSFLCLPSVWPPSFLSSFCPFFSIFPLGSQIFYMSLCFSNMIFFSTWSEISWEKCKEPFSCFSLITSISLQLLSFPKACSHIVAF